jgi:hypothetical protein
MKKLRAIFTLKFFVAAFVALIVTIVLPIAGFLTLCWLVARRASVTASFVEKFVFTVLASLVVNAFVYELAGALHIHPNIEVIGILYLLACLPLLYWQPKAESAPFISRRVFVAAAGFAMVFAFFMYPVTVSPNARASHSIATLHMLTAGEDNASHYALFKYAYLHKGFAYSSKQNNDSGIIANLENYPQGSEFSMSWLTQAVFGGRYENNDKILLFAYYTWCAVSYALVSALVLLLATAAFEATRKTVRLSQTTLGVITVFAIVGLSSMLYLVGRGFQSQIFSYLYLLGLLYATLPFIKIEPLKFRAVFLATMFAGICISWWFLAPVAFCMAVAFLVPLRKTWRQLVSLPMLILVGLIALAALYPIIVNYMSGATSGNVLNQDGGVDTIAATTIIFYLLGWPCFAWATRKTYKEYLAIHLAILGWLAFTAFIGVYQTLTLHHFSYYYYKSLYTLIPLSGMMIIFLGMSLIESIKISKKLFAQVAVSALVSILFINYFISIKPVYPRVYLNDWFNNPIVPSDLTVMYTTPKSQFADVVYVGGCSPGSTYILNRWSGALFQSELGMWHRDIELYGLYGDSQLEQLFPNPYPSKSKVYMFVETACVNAHTVNLIRGVGTPSNVDMVQQLIAPNKK